MGRNMVAKRFFSQWGKSFISLPAAHKINMKDRETVMRYFLLGLQVIGDYNYMKKCHYNNSQNT